MELQEASERQRQKNQLENRRLTLAEQKNAAKMKQLELEQKRLEFEMKRAETENLQMQMFSRMIGMGGMGGMGGMSSMGATNMMGVDNMMAPGKFGHDFVPGADENNKEPPNWEDIMRGI